MFNINQFKQNFRGGARKNKFRVAINEDGFVLGSKFSDILVQATSIPSFTIEDIEVPSLAGIIKVAGKRTVNDWDVSIILDEDLSENGIDLLEQWQFKARQMISAEGSNDVRLNSPSNVNYKTDATLYQLDQKGNTIASYRLEGIWPKEIGERSFDYNDDEIVTCDVTFAVDDIIRDEQLPQPKF